MKSLDQIFNERGADKGSLWHEYSAVYEPLFCKWRHEPIQILEIGTQFFNSVKSWLEYFTKAEVYGVDVYKGEPFLNDPRFHFRLGNQRDTAFWDKFKYEVPKCEIIVDDGEHAAEASRISFEALWPHVWPGGVYVVEDIFSWWDGHFGPVSDANNWICQLVSDVNWAGKAHHGKPEPKPYTLTEYEATIESIQLTKGLMIITKRMERSK